MEENEKVPPDAAAIESILEAVSDPRWDFRTVDGISRQTGLSNDVVAAALGKLADSVRVSDVPDKKGRRLFTLRSRPVGFLERIADLRNFLAKSST